MGARLPWLLLVISVALNLFFVVGVLYSDMTAESGEGAAPDARLATTVERLGLDEAERQALIALRDRVATRREAMRSRGITSAKKSRRRSIRASILA